jgi:hypothetical protein
MPRTIIFLSGWGVPTWLAKTKYVWNAPFWKEYNAIYVPSKTPRSDNMVERELENLCQLVNAYPNATLVGQSLGAWWAANLACYPKASISKLVLWTPLCDAGQYPIFNVTDRHNPLFKTTNANNCGPHRTLVTYAYNDFLVPFEFHSVSLVRKFNSTVYKLDGGHWFQKNHQAGLSYMKEWIDI